MCTTCNSRRCEDPRLRGYLKFIGPRAAFLVGGFIVATKSRANFAGEGHEEIVTTTYNKNENDAHNKSADLQFLAKRGKSSHTLGSKSLLGILLGILR